MQMIDVKSMNITFGWEPYMNRTVTNIQVIHEIQKHLATINSDDDCFFCVQIDMQL